MRRTTRILRYVGNKETAEPLLYDPVERSMETLLLPETVALAHGDLQKFAEMVTNPLFSDMQKDQESGLFVPLPKPNTWASVMRSAFQAFQPSQIETKPDPPEEPFEVNLTTPLVGYRSWNILNGLLASLNTGDRWPIDKPMTAQCVGGKQCYPCPTEHCTCGIYAVDEIQDLHAGDLWGRVYGWGRYVRGETGWRAQFAYPAEFFLAADHDREKYLAVLRKYHVPISQFMPIQVYHPSEDGYENWQDQENRNLGACRDSDSEED